MKTRDEITQLLNAWKGGDRAANEEVASWVFGELRRLAEVYMRGERAGHTLQPTALINETYIRLLDWEGVNWQNRAHFKGTFATLMRRVLVEYARRRNADKRRRPDELDPLVPIFFSEQTPDLVALDDALTGLSNKDSRKSQIVELHFFGGFTLEEIAAALEVSLTTVKRDLKFAEAWLKTELDRSRR